MAPILKTLQQVANDFRPLPVHRPAVVTLAEKHRGVFRDAVIGLLLLGTVMSMAMLWSIWKLNRAMEFKPSPVVALPVPTPPPEKISVKLEPSASPQDIPLPPTPTTMQDIPQAEPYVDIVLPAEDLKNETHTSDAAPAPDSAPTVSVVAEKIGEVPVRTNIRPQRQQPVHLDLTPEQTLPKDQLLTDAHLLLQSGDSLAALDLYNQVLLHDHDNQAALQGKMYALQRSGQYEQAVEIGHQLQKLNPENQDSRVDLITALSQSYKPSAMGELQKIVDVNPDNAAARAALARLLMRRGYIEEAFKQLSRAAQIAPRNIGYRLDLAILYDQAGHPQEALQSYRQVLLAASDEDNPSAVAVPLASVRKRAQYLEAIMAVSAP